MTITKAPLPQPFPALLMAALQGAGGHWPSIGRGPDVGAHSLARPIAPEQCRRPSDAESVPGPGATAQLPDPLEGPLWTGRGLLELPLGSWGEGAVSCPRTGQGALSLRPWRVQVPFCQESCSPESPRPGWQAAVTAPQDRSCLDGMPALALPASSTVPLLPSQERLASSRAASFAHVSRASFPSRPQRLW